MKKLHKWPSLLIAVFLVLWAISGIILNHRYTFSSFDVDRSLLPKEHQYSNWNNAALKGAVRLDSLRVLFYGNVGVWEYDEIKDQWVDFNAGLPGGADHHKINCLLKTSTSDLYAGTRFGLYHFIKGEQKWVSVQVPHHDEHVVDLLELNDSLMIMTRSHLWKIPLVGTADFTYVTIPAPLGYDNNIGLFKTLWVIHSGEIYGIAGKLLVDAVAAIFIFLTLSGLVYFFSPRIIRNRKKNDKEIKRISLWNRWSIKWHNKIGVWLVLILLVTTFTGMFLRPPLLIAIASGRVGKIPYSVLDDGNPWYDQLRRLIYDVERDKIYLATSEGIFQTDTEFTSSPEFSYPQPPVSVMGYNVFTVQPDGKILVGSFSGMYAWDPDNNFVQDYISRRPYTSPIGLANPIGSNMISGYYMDAKAREYIFDYNRGALSFDHRSRFPEMPEKIRNSRMPLWNFALEMHTARLLKPMLGDFYILFIPLFGLSTLMILISGLILWIRKYNRRRRYK